MFFYNVNQIILRTFCGVKNIIIIDKGTLDGVNLESGVISPEGAVGIVKNVTKNYASIISLLMRLFVNSINSRLFLL